MKWGVRRYQNKDGSLTRAGKKRYSAEEKRELKAKDKARRIALKQEKNAEKAKKYQDKADAAKAEVDDLTKNGLRSKTFKSAYGGFAYAPDPLFFSVYGKTKKQALNSMIESDKKKIEVYEKAAKDKAAGKLTDSQKMLMGAAAVAVALTAAYAGKKYLDLKSSKAEMDRINSIVGGQKISYDDFMKKYMGSETRLFDTISQDAYSQLSDVDVKLTTGQIFHRISTSDEQSLTYKVKGLFGIETSVTKDRLYLAFTEEDVNRYKAVLPKYWWKQWGFKNTSGYDVAYKALTDIKSPSAKTRVDIYTDLIKNDSSIRSMVEQCCKVLPGKANLDTSRMSAEELSRQSYSYLAAILCDKNNNIGNKYIEAIKNLGYNAIIDDNDAGRLSDSPIIILDPVKNVVRAGAEVLGSKEINSAAKNLVEIFNRK